ncbi:MAG TPA: polysaccharide biosynthesis C-terminal domain-containing protein, partial [Pararhizobium sp.]|nr:polysaccharide biosynthesis C-terminal domain-containing protein [Pararhizobium sp.]
LTGPARSVAMATGNTRFILLWELLALAIRLPLILAGLYLFGLPGVVWARVLSGLSLVLLGLEVMRQLVGVPLVEQILAPWRSLVSGAAMFLTLIFVQGRINLNGGNVIDLSIYVASMAAFGFLLYMIIHTFLWALSGFQDGPERKLLGIISQIRHMRASKAS